MFTLRKKLQGRGDLINGSSAPSQASELWFETATERRKTESEAGKQGRRPDPHGSSAFQTIGCLGIDRSSLVLRQGEQKGESQGVAGCPC